MADPWTFKENVNGQHAFDLLLCIIDIIDAANELKDADETNAGVRSISTARRMSIPLRKLLLDGNGYLFQDCLDSPRLHPLKHPTPEERTITFVQKFKRPAITFGWADGRQETIEIPEYEQRTTIHPLYGLRHCDGQEFVVKMPFDYDAAPVKFKAWMNAKVLQIDSIDFSAKDLLREVANNEGAHIDGVKLSLPDAIGVSFDNQKNTRYKAVNSVKFGPLSYAQLFCIWTGIYVADSAKSLIDHLPFDEGTSTAMADISRKIAAGPREIFGRFPVENQTYHGLLIGSDRKLRSESIGDYSTLMKIP